MCLSNTAVCMGNVALWHMPADRARGQGRSHGKVQQTCQSEGQLVSHVTHEPAMAHCAG